MYQNSTSGSNQSYGGYDPNAGLAAFQNFYAQQTSIPGPLRPRPRPVSTPLFYANGLEMLHRDTENLPYLDPSKPSVGVEPLVDQKIMAYDLWGGKKERCGCGGVKIPAPTGFGG